MTERSEIIAVVSGGAGFIGSNLCDRLVGEGARVVCLDDFSTGLRANVGHLEGHPRFELIEHDAIEPWPERLRPTRIYHLACPASPPHYQADPERTLLTNVLGTRNALRLAEQTGARLLLSSTSEVYGDPEVHPQPEDYRGNVNCTGPRACYDEGKRAAESLAFDYHRAGRADIRIARIFNTYGPRMRRDDGRVVSNLVCQALAGEPLTVYGDGSQTRCFCFVDDTVEGLTRLMESDCAAVPVNLGDPREMPISALVEAILRQTGSSSPVVHRTLPTDDPRRRWPDIGRAIELLDWRPATSLEEGLEATINWFSKDVEGAAVRTAIAAQ